MNPNDLQARMLRVENLLDYYARLEATTGTAGLLGPTDKTKLNAATTANTANTLVLRDGGGNIAGPGLATSAYSGWNAVTFQPNWSNFGGTFRVAKYLRDAQGWVHLRGLVTKSTAIAVNDVICVLPVGFRPTVTDGFESTKQTAGVNGRVELRVDSAGNVYPSEALAAGSLIWLNAIIFDPVA